MGSNLDLDLLQALDSCNISRKLQDTLMELVGKSDDQNQFSKPMPWIGIYIALASLFCVLSMLADLLHGLRNRKLWFPCKYFTLNAVSLTVMAIAVKLPMDLNNSMPGDGDQLAKLGSMGFMCILMANLLPSLATMDSNQLFTNIIALGVLVITLVVNVCIQISTGVVSDHYKTAATFFMAVLLMLLMIYICSSLAILKSKQILESKYKVAQETALKELQQAERLSVEKLKQHVKNYWIMAGTGSPQFMTVCSATTSACGVVCVVTTLFSVIIKSNSMGSVRPYQSDYRRSLTPINVTQVSGLFVGTIAPIFRCFATLHLKLSVKRIWNHVKIFKVESYWTQKLFDWKRSSNVIPFPLIYGRKFKVSIERLKVLILSVCIGLQKSVVVACKMISMTLIFVMIFVWCCCHYWKWLKAMLGASGFVSIEEPSNDLSRLYVLQLQDDMEFAERTLKYMSKSMNCLIKNDEKHQPNDLMKLLAESRGFDGVRKYDSHHVQPLLSKECRYPDCWSLPLVNLTIISISLPNIRSNRVNRLLSGVSQGLVYVTHVEENLNIGDDYKSIQRAARILWLELEVYQKWLGNKLQNPGPRANTTRQILQWFRDTAKNRFFNGSGPNDDSISANSMYRIAETILHSYDADIDLISEEQLFLQLSSMIADILAACFTNLPQVMVMKCHESCIEKREVSVQEAAQLLGETMQIIKTLQDREMPCLRPDEMPFIEKWHAYSRHPFP